MPLAECILAAEQLFFCFRRHYGYVGSGNFIFRVVPPPFTHVLIEYLEATDIAPSSIQVKVAEKKPPVQDAGHERW
jgi:hypothetical protein